LQIGLEKKEKIRYTIRVNADRAHPASRNRRKDLCVNE
jgi:hypothetical protein